jgi:hypothetical protein
VVLTRRYHARAHNYRFQRNAAAAAASERRRVGTRHLCARAPTGGIVNQTLIDRSSRRGGRSDRVAALIWAGLGWADLS